MKKNEQKIWNDVIRSHWWAQGHYLIVCNLIRGYITKNNVTNLCGLDVGCSNGHVTKFLRQFGQAYGFDISYDGLSYSDTRSGILQADAVNIPFRDEVFNLVTLLDVVEHTDDDYGVFREVYRVCAKSAIVAVNVPAHRCLWGEHDEWNRHRRRYKKSDLVKIAESCNFKIERITYLHPHLFPFLFIHSAIGRLRQRKTDARNNFISFNPFVDRMLLNTLLVEKRVANSVNFPFGTSLFAILKKDE